MNNEKETISKEEAAATLKSVDLTKRDAIKSFRIPLLLITLISLSYSLIVFSWGMTEHENMWALGMYIGLAGLLIFTALYVYTFRLLGIKLDFLARTKERVRFELVQVVVFTVILIAGRQVRLLGFEFAPHIAALIAGGYLAYLLYKYPTGEYITMDKNHD
jgi:hypothetical protein